MRAGSNAGAGRMELALEDPGFYVGDTEAIYRRLRGEAPVYWCESARLWALSKHADIRAVSRNPDLFCSGRGVLVNDPLRDAATDVGPPSIIQMDPPAHNRFRQLVAKAFTPRLVRELEPRMRAVARASIEAVPTGRTVDFVEHLSVPLPIAVIAEMMGIPNSDRADFKRWSDAMIEGGDHRSDETLVLQAELFDYFRRVIEARRKEPRKDLVSALIAAEIDGEHLTEEELLIFCMTLLVAGNETTRNLISGGAKALIDFGEQRSRLIADPSLMEGAVEEMLRWVTPVHAFARTATRDTEIRGQAIAAGDFVLMLYASGNRDEEVWGESAAVFDVTRPISHDHVAFGFGQHACVGASLARLEARVLFEELLARRPDFDLDGDVTRLRSTIMNGIERMPVVFAG